MSSGTCSEGGHGNQQRSWRFTGLTDLLLRLEGYLFHHVIFQLRVLELVRHYPIILRPNIPRWSFIGI